MSPANNAGGWDPIPPQPWVAAISWDQWRTIVWLTAENSWRTRQLLGDDYQAPPPACLAKWESPNSPFDFTCRLHAGHDGRHLDGVVAWE